MANEMTNEEAIAYIQEWLKDEYAVNSKDRKALNAAIKALSREPCDDCISREDTLARLRADTSFVCTGDKLQAIEIVNNMPPVTPQPKTEVLDEIRDEIEEQVLESLSDGGDDWFAAEKVNECLEIIDKHREE